MFRDGTKLVLEQAQSWFWSGWFRVSTKPVLEQAQSPFWSGWLRVGTKPVLEQAQSRFGCGKIGLVSRQVFASFIEATKLDLSQTGQYKTCIVSNTMQVLLYIFYILHILIYSLYIYKEYTFKEYIYKEYIKNMYIKNIYKENIHIFIDTQSILVFDTLQVLYWPILGQIQFCSFDRRCKTCLDTKPVL